MYINICTHKKESTQQPNSVNWANLNNENKTDHVLSYNFCFISFFIRWPDNIFVLFQPSPLYGLSLKKNLYHPEQKNIKKFFFLMIILFQIIVLCCKAIWLMLGIYVTLQRIIHTVHCK